jgi:hypothetical protein
MGLAAAERRIEPKHGGYAVAATGEPSANVVQELFQAFGRVRVGEEGGRVGVVARRTARQNIGDIGSILAFRDRAFSDVVSRSAEIEDCRETHVQPVHL